MSRALGDFEFKKNYSLPAEKQVITADPDVTCHEVTEEDEFLVLACDGGVYNKYTCSSLIVGVICLGIWDCLTSQQVVDFVRLQVAEGKELGDIAEIMCDHCLAPDTTSGAGIGCDNMTVLIVAILHGRTKEEWYQWVKDRVEKGYGYKTPNVLPQLYSQSRLMAYRAKKEAQDARTKARPDEDENANPASVWLSGSGLSGFARVLGSTGGISFHPGSGIMNDTGNLMFASANDDSDDGENDDDDLHASGPYHNSTFGGKGSGYGESSIQGKLTLFDEGSDDGVFNCFLYRPRYHGSGF